MAIQARTPDLGIRDQSSLLQTAAWRQEIDHRTSPARTEVDQQKSKSKVADERVKGLTS